MTRNTSLHFGSLRVFRCGSCNHKMRLGASECGRCYQSTPFYNRGWFVVLVASIFILGMAELFYNIVS